MTEQSEFFLPFLSSSCHYVDRVFDWPVTARLYLPHGWIHDDARRRKAHVPKSVRFQTKGEIGLDLVKWSAKCEIPFGAVVIDAGYGDQPALLDGLVALGIPHIAGVSSSTRFRPADLVETDQGDPAPPPHSGRGRPKKAATIKERIPTMGAREIIGKLPIVAWRRVAWRNGTKGPLIKEFARFEVFRTAHRGAPLLIHGWLMAERSVSKNWLNFRTSDGSLSDFIRMRKENSVSIIMRGAFGLAFIATLRW